MRTSFRRIRQHVSTFMVLAIELVAAVPHLLRRAGWRMSAACALIALQVLILLTGNYTFFNLLTIALTLFLFDDQAIASKSAHVRYPLSPRRVLMNSRSRLPRLPAPCTGIALLSLGVSGSGLAPYRRERRPAYPSRFRLARSSASPFQIVNSYGLFAVMTTTRPEIIVEGSDDGDTWLRIRIPLQARRSESQRRAWLHRFSLVWIGRCGSPRWATTNPTCGSLDSLAAIARRFSAGAGLIEKNPFPERPPRFIRAQLYDYSFTEFGERRTTGAWWKRQPMGTYLPPIGLKSAAANGANRQVPR